MNEGTYLRLFSHLTPLIKKQDTIMRETATPLYHTGDYQQYCDFLGPEGVMKT
jgi:hypothetical protein